jgi:hypothetical protein
MREAWWLVSTIFNSMLLSVYQGDWRAARELSELGRAVQPDDPRHLALRAVLEYELGELEEGTAHLDRLQAAAERVPPPGMTAEHVLVAHLIPVLNRIANVEDRMDAALAAADRVLSLPALTPGLVLGARAGLALIAVQREDAGGADELYGSLESQRGTASLFLPLALDRLLGLLAVTCGRVETALVHFEDGLAFCDRAGYRPEHAWTGSDYAEALLERGGAGDREKAAGLQETALATARELGMRPLEERILSRRELLQA